MQAWLSTKFCEGLDQNLKCEQTLNVADVHFTFLSVNLTASRIGKSFTDASNFVIKVETLLFPIHKSK